jgi:hypothetical protein
LSRSTTFVIVRPEVKVSGGFFFGIGRTTELWYNIRSNTVQESVKRSDGDFEWFRKTLYKLHPGYYVRKMLSKIAPFSKFVGDLDK